MVWDERIDEKLRNIDAYNGGKMAGIEEGRREAIINMYNNNLSVDIISKCVNLTTDEVNEIIKTNIH